MSNNSKKHALNLLASVNGHVSIQDGIATLPDGTTVNLALTVLLDKADKDKLAKAYAALMSRKLGGKVWAFYDDDIRKVTIRGELPTKQELVISHSYPSTWSMLDHHSVSKCKERLLEAMNDPSFQSEVALLIA